MNILKRAYCGFWEWLEEEPTGRQYWKFLFKSWLIFLAYGVLFGIIILIYKEKANSPTPDTFDWRFGKLADNLFFLSPAIFLITVIVLTSLEELIFRWLPLLAGVKIFGRSALTLITAISSSVIFGWLHGVSYPDHLKVFLFILLQGVLGFWLCLVYLKCGSFYKHNLKALFSSLAIHLSYNILSLGIVYMIISFYPDEFLKMSDKIF